MKTSRLLVQSGRERENRWILTKCMLLTTCVWSGNSVFSTISPNFWLSSPVPVQHPLEPDPTVQSKVQQNLWTEPSVRSSVLLKSTLTRTDPNRDITTSRLSEKSAYFNEDSWHEGRTIQAGHLKHLIKTWWWHWRKARWDAIRPMRYLYIFTFSSALTCTCISWMIWMGDGKWIQHNLWVRWDNQGW